jgi:hypothetical protein
MMSLRPRKKTLLELLDGEKIRTSLSGDHLPPCDIYSCEWREACKTERLACESFIIYVNSGKSVLPAKVWKWLYGNRSVLHRPSGDMFLRAFAGFASEEDATETERARQMASADSTNQESTHA